MIQTLAKSQKRLAALFCTVFYLQLALPSLARSGGPYHLSITPGKTVFDLPAPGSYRESAAPKPKPEPEAAKAVVKSAINTKAASPGGVRSIKIGGPGQPEMDAFKSASADNMVDLFTGDFSYNIPLMDVGGYPVNIHYSSGISMDQEASWVGLGWNINPGTIGRSVRGLPDDFNGEDTISKTQSLQVNRTVGVTVGADLEVGGFPIKNGDAKISLSASLGVFRNSYNGWGVELGINPSINVGSTSFGTLSAGLSLSSNTQSGVNVSPSIGYSMKKMENGSPNMGLSTNYNSRSGISALQLNTSIRKEGTYVKNQKDYYGSHTGPSAAISFAVPTYTPSISIPYTSTQYSFRAKVGNEAWILHASPFVHGYVSKQEIADEDKLQRKPAIGYLYYSKGNDNNNTLLDFNREKDLSFNSKSTPLIAIPQYTYDVYSISGEGTGGMFRPYRGDIGFMRDDNMRSKSKSNRLSVDLGFGNLFHGGIDFSFTNSFSENNLWKGQNDINPHLKFRTNDTTYEAVYFRNPGERTTNAQSFYDAVGDDAIMRVKLDGQKDDIKASSAYVTFRNGRKTGELPVTAPIVKGKRDKRSQVISYMTAEDAAQYGLDKYILSYKPDSIPGLATGKYIDSIKRFDGSIRKRHHLSQITVLNGDGRTYIYGAPAYNLEQTDVSFSVKEETNSSNLARGLVDYTPGLDNSTANDKGKEHAYSRESVPAYAHSFLLTGIVSPDYVDIRNDGITEDDMGNAVKFNYTRVYGGNTNAYAWRTPLDQNRANYSEGLKSDNRDDKGTYLYGKKEVWYLHSIESKTMVAVFKVAYDRKDVCSVAGENGGADATKKMGRLKEIDLFVKADLVKNGYKARPVKTVHFSYSYLLCKGVAGVSTEGKLTLDSIWFSYNGNEKGKLNPYVFRYHAGDAARNPSYNVKYYDRWGNYKDPAVNPKPNMPNADYPYAQQDSTQAAKFAAAWTLDEVLMPSGGRIKVKYESDDYAYVQNKRAVKFFKIAGIGKTASDSVGTALYNSDTCDYRFVFVKTESLMTGKNDIFRKYLEGNQYIYFKMAVRVPADRWGGGIEYVPVYAEVEDYGLVSARRIWLKLRKVEGQSPLARAALQFLRLQLPSKAYPDSEPGLDVSVWDVVRLIATSAQNMKESLTKYDKLVRLKGYCNFIDTTASFVRLNAPDYKKYGGGLRVKRVEIYDNWNKMTGQKESVYGQTYSYTRTEKVDGKDVTISSGVASYEPMIGAEENVFHTPIPYAEKIAPMAPVNYMFAELPLGEAYYPSASVGYSKVRVRTINAKAKSANGWQESEFYTTRDFPTLVENTILDNDAKRQHNPRLANILRINARNFITLSQGFRIELNDMNGKPKAQYSYAETDSLRPIAYTRNFYKVDNDTAYQKHLNNSVWVVDSVNGHINKNGTVGKDIEVMQDFREQYSRTISGDYEANIDIFLVGFFPGYLPSLFPMPQKEEVRYRSAATVKLVQRYGILDSVVVMDKGSTVSTKNLLYDAETGEVLLSRTSNEFNDPIFNFSYPAHWAYSGMGAAYKNIDAIFSNLKLVQGRLYYGAQSTTTYPVERFFESGDEVYLTGIIRDAQTGSGNCTQFAPMSPAQADTTRPIPMKAWVVDAGKTKGGGKGLFFMDGYGRPITCEVNTMRILRSGKRNLLDASVGSIVSMANPVREVSAGHFMLVFDTSSRVINTAASTYKDIWKTDNFTFQKDTVIKVWHSYTVSVSPKDVTNKRWDKKNAHVNIPGSKNLIAALDFIRKRACHDPVFLFTKSIVSFDLTAIPRNAVVTSASLSLKGRLARDYMQQEKISGYCGTDKGFNWPGSTNYTERASASHLKRIIAPWNSNTPYQSVITTTANQVALDATSTTGISCGALIQDVIANTNYGIVMELDKTNCDDIQQSNVDYVNFCARTEPGANSIITSCSTNANMPCNCSAPVLTIHYDVLEDSLGLRCKDLASEPSVNPYRFGIFGNWRMDRAYTFYHDRKESSAINPETNIRKEGELKDFETFWKFSNTALKALPDTGKWVWNSAASLYTRKGLEMENYDPLGRYNAGRYGYNGTLPVAVAQNSRYRELLYDGFEDYGYKAEKTSACNTPREIDFVRNQSGVALTGAISHTGVYSLKVDAGATASFTAPVINNPADTTSVAMGIDSANSSGCTVLPYGTGLKSTYEGYPKSECAAAPEGIRTSYPGSTGAVNTVWGRGAPDTAICADWFSVTWQGFLQVPYTDYYHFYALSDRSMQVYVDGVNVAEAITPDVEASGRAILLEGGGKYQITLKYQHTTGSNAYARLRWSRQGAPSSLEVIPAKWLYVGLPKEGDSSVVCGVPVPCIDTDSITVGKGFNPGFSPVLNSKMVVSAWVRMDMPDCNAGTMPDNVIAVTRIGAGNSESSVYLQKTGVRIEGWQRYEAVVTIENAHHLRLSAIATSEHGIFVDDIRVQPYNSAVKTYAYDPANLRLMAELDENNYASFYEYDDDGTLIRIKKETARGVMTIKESRSALLKTN